MMPNAVARRAKKLLATRWLADDEFDDDGFDAALDELEVAAIGLGVPEATAPTPPVTGPESETCK